MITKVQLFLNMKNEGVARPLGIQRLRRAPGCGQKFAIAVDGRSVHAGIMRFSSATGRRREATVRDVYAEGSSEIGSAPQRRIDIEMNLRRRPSFARDG